MPEMIFWDTWAYIALVDKGSDAHEKALVVAKHLKKRRDVMITTSAILTEIGDAYAKKHLRHLAFRQRQFISEEIARGAGRLMLINDHFWYAGWELYEQRPDKDWGHTDCMSFVVMRELQITKAFTADVHFEQAGFERLVKI